MGAIGNANTPIFVDSDGSAKPCAESIHEIGVENKGTDRVIATITIDGVPYDIKNVPADGLAFAVTFVDYDGRELKKQAVLKGGTATAPNHPDSRQASGYDPNGWDVAFNNVQSDLTVTAQYKIKTFTVTFRDHDDTVLKTETVNWGGNATPPNNPTWEGHTFKSWSGTYTSVKANQTVTATYNINTYTVKFFKNINGSRTQIGDTQTVNYGGSAIPPAKPTETGYNTGDWIGDYANVKKNTEVDIYLTIKTFTVTFKYDNGSADFVKTGVTYGTTIGSIKPADPTKEGWTFTGWSMPDETQVINNYVVTAEYTEIIKHTVRFYADENKSILLNSQTVTHGSAPAEWTPSLQGWTWSGSWYNWSVPFGNPIYQDTDYHTEWTASISSNVTISNTGANKDNPLIECFNLTNGIIIPVGATVSIASFSGTITHHNSGMAHVLEMSCHFSSSSSPSTDTLVGDTLNFIETTDKTGGGGVETFPFDYESEAEYDVPSGVVALALKLLKRTTGSTYWCTAKWSVDYTLKLNLY